MNLARNGRSLQLNAGLQMLGQLAQALFGRTQLQVGLHPRTARSLCLHRLQQGRHQASEVVFQQVVAGPVAHGFHRSVLANFTGHEHEGNVAPAGHQQIQRKQTRKAGQVVVGHDDIPRLLYGAKEVGLGVHPTGRDFQAATAQLGQHQLVIEL